ncbi:thyroglobulin-like [Uranotaenia lowii]|uniref:thyroglobulin-like n=1 Tax=Uranotaenia lowii TaxID=190385 RepID=UPI0024792644|nr:thyroglobulin-like [Uranotaenia lowii]
MKFLIFLSILEIALISINAQKSCDSILGCMGNLECPEGEFLEPHGSENGCCPGCVGGKLLKEPCNETVLCAPGLQCVTDACALDPTSCASTHHIQEGVTWKPACDAAGHFWPKQCHGDNFSGRCFCYSSLGERIFGWQWRSKAADMTCSCSRRRSDLEAQGRRDVTLHCTEDGSFEPLQCDGGVCWCADRETGNPLPNIPVVTESMWKRLPCYNILYQGTEYLRQCESARYAQELMSTKFIIHGQVNVTLTKIHCDYDGSYGRYAIDRDYIYCIWRDGSQMEPFHAIGADLSTVNCCCSRRRAKLEAEGRTDVTLHCAQNGNFEELQCDSGFCWCADEFDGVPLLGTSVVPEGLWKFLPCYNQTLHGEFYLRQCESSAFAQRAIQKKFALRGTLGITFNDIKCDYDGAYGAYMIENGIVYCTWRDGKKIGSYQVRSSLVSSVNCNCARDSVIFQEVGIPFTLACGGNGNYENLQDQNGQLFCVDNDGYVVFTDVRPNESCDKFIYNSVFYKDD